MSEENKEEVPIAVPNPKQYMMITDQIGVALIGRICPGIKFLEIEGMMIDGTLSHQFLVNPLPKIVAGSLPTEDHASTPTETA